LGNGGQFCAMCRTFLLCSGLLLLGAVPASAQKALYESVNIQAFDQRLAAGADTVFVVNFWATWCAPCIRELPHFDALQKEHADKKLKVLLVSVDAPSRAKAALSDFLNDREVVCQVLHLNESKPHEYIDRIAPQWSGSIPATLVIPPSPGKRLFHEGEMSLNELQHWIKPLINVP